MSDLAISSLCLLGIVFFVVSVLMFVDKPQKKLSRLDQGRFAFNLQIMIELTDYLNKNRSIRFGQALLNLGILQDLHLKTKDGGQEIVTDRRLIYEEPWTTLARMTEELDKQK
jgi:hypothetical protein